MLKDTRFEGPFPVGVVTGFWEYIIRNNPELLEGKAQFSGLVNCEKNSACENLTLNQPSDSEEHNNI